MRTLHQDVFIGIGMLILSLFLYIKTFEFAGEAALYPRGLLLLLTIFGILIVYGGFKKTKQLKEGEDVQSEGEEEKLTFSTLKSPLTILLLVMIYAGLISLIGFFPSTILFVIVFLWYVGVKKWTVYVYTVVGLNLFIYVLFVLQLNVQLPVGALFN
ncbi:tripartite tricarboxylate transporter TctB family protein [Halalkalibacter alkaliphilus]|uniref:Tripartite tricarboxylate transporter TctB family protein n=1 Tax=Halalkalibacter alkaliphilus TaxID=2917993 RepID=A0A9X2CV48_9BACI|nr:tripartite tricarboxylate transporter TctB family protein [Halalkalibacter alkaliphilus]MCL7748842.1 tripartite tricarboxylate transporter TctB family protein [Halalkalibacter alkaliphilus]